VLTWRKRHAIIKLTKAKAPKQKIKGGISSETSDDKGNQKEQKGGTGDA
jgi:hypothetical protein